MEADFVIVGAGSAGCALGARLGATGASVIVIEHGGSDAGPFIQMPGALSYPMNMSCYDWGYKTEPEPHMGGRRLACPRGKVIGGSSSINGMVYVRGHARDFDTWEEMGATGWSYADVLPYYRRMECWHGDAGDPAWRGLDGPLHVSRGPRDNPLVQGFIKAGTQAGYPATDDYNGAQQEGFGAMEATIWKGQRWSAANAYLHPAKARGDVTVIRGFAARVAIREGRAIGVELSGRGGTGRTLIRARREVVLAAGAIGSPRLLLSSGIGPAAQLGGMGIDIVADRPGVGGNLQDHLEVYVQVAASKPVSLYSVWNLPGKAKVGLEWLLARRGLGASNQIEATGFIRSGPEVDYPDIQFHFIPLAVRYDGRAAFPGHGFQAHVGPMRSQSRGRVSLAGPDPRTAPEIRFNYMSLPQDWAEFRKAIRLTREILGQPALAEFTKAEIQPGPAVQSDDELDAFVRDHAESAYHPCGTCRMGARSDADAVVDPEARVIGVERLRVADSSIFPRITNGNLNAPSIMVGEKVADHILGRGMLPRAERARAEPAMAE